LEASPHPAASLHVGDIDLGRPGVAAMGVLGWQQRAEDEDDLRQTPPSSAEPPALTLDTSSAAANAAGRPCGHIDAKVSRWVGRFLLLAPIPQGSIDLRMTFIPRSTSLSLFVLILKLVSYTWTASVSTRIFSALVCRTCARSLRSRNSQKSGRYGGRNFAARSREPASFSPPFLPFSVTSSEETQPG